MKYILLIIICLCSCTKRISNICLKCQDKECIYTLIEQETTDKTDIDYFKAILKVAKKRNLTEKQIQLLFVEYYL